MELTPPALPKNSPRLRWGGLTFVIRLVFGLCMTTGSVQAELLLDALSATYGYNPRLDAERAFERGTDEGVARHKMPLSGNPSL